MIEFLTVFVIGFFFELTLCLYTRAVASGNIRLATTMTPICGLIAALGVTGYVHKPLLVIPLLLGETLATYLVLTYSKE